VAALALVTLPLAAMPHSEQHEVRREIDQLEARWRSAAVTRNLTAMNTLLADDYMGITPNGSLQSKDDTIAALRAGSLHFTSINVLERKVRFYGSTALVTSRAEVVGTGPAGDISGSYRYTRVYVRNPSGVWQIVSFEASRIGDNQGHH
jgi:ketosteroid isomerase-like protein